MRTDLSVNRKASRYRPLDTVSDSQIILEKDVVPLAVLTLLSQHRGCSISGINLLFRHLSWRGHMRGLLAPLSTHEEAALRKVGFGSADSLEPAHVRRLLQLELIERVGCAWRLTPLGRRRYDALVCETVQTSAA